MTREQHLKLADAALTKAERVADTAEHLARGTRSAEAVPLTAAGALWERIAHTHIDLARELRETTPEPSDG